MIRYAITDRQFFAGDERQKQLSLLTQARQLGAAGIDFLQIREKDLPPSDLLTLTTAIRATLPVGSGPRLLLNTNLTVAIEAEADGLHLPGGSNPAELSTTLASARLAFARAGRPHPTLSVSTHSLDEVRGARDAGADLILFGPIFEKRVRGELVRPGLGLEALAEAAHLAGGAPLLALGGVTAVNLDSCLAAGAAGVAAIRLFLHTGQPCSALP